MVTFYTSLTVSSPFQQHAQHAVASMTIMKTAYTRTDQLILINLRFLCSPETMLNKIRNSFACGTYKIDRSRGSFVTGTSYPAAARDVAEFGTKPCVARIAPIT